MDCDWIEHSGEIGSGLAFKSRFTSGTGHAVGCRLVGWSLGYEKKNSLWFITEGIVGMKLESTSINEMFSVIIYTLCAKNR